MIRPLCPDAFVLIDESASNEAELLQRFPIDTPDTFYAVASGCLGWGMPASVGLALAEQSSGRHRPVMAIIGDDSFQYSPQSIYSGVQQQAHVVFVVLKNKEYAILKEFAVLEEAPGLPGLDLPGLDMVALGNGYGACTARRERGGDPADVSPGPGLQGHERHRDPGHHGLAPPWLDAGRTRGAADVTGHAGLRLVKIGGWARKRAHEVRLYLASRHPVSRSGTCWRPGWGGVNKSGLAAAGNRPSAAHPAGELARLVAARPKRRRDLGTGVSPLRRADTRR